MENNQMENNQMENNQMENKSVDVLIAGLEQNLVNVINGSGLPPSITRYVIGDIAAKVQEVATQDIMRARQMSGITANVTPNPPKTQQETTHIPIPAPKIVEIEKEKQKAAEG